MHQPKAKTSKLMQLDKLWDMYSKEMDPKKQEFLMRQIEEATKFAQEEQRANQISDGFDRLANRMVGGMVDGYMAAWGQPRPQITHVYQQEIGSDAESENNAPDG